MGRAWLDWRCIQETEPLKTKAGRGTAIVAPARVLSIFREQSIGQRIASSKALNYAISRGCRRPNTRSFDTHDRPALLRSSGTPARRSATEGEQFPEESAFSIVRRHGRRSQNPRVKLCDEHPQNLHLPPDQPGTGSSRLIFLDRPFTVVAQAEWELDENRERCESPHSSVRSKRFDGKRQQVTA